MPSYKIDKDNITVGEPLKADIVALFDYPNGTNTVQDIELQGENAAVKLNEIIGNSELTKQDIIENLTEMNKEPNGMLLHIGRRSGWNSAPKKDTIKLMADHLFATIQYHRILALAAADSNFHERLIAEKKGVIAKLRQEKSAEEVLRLFNEVKDNTKNWNDTRAAMEALGFVGEATEVKQLYGEAQYLRLLGLAGDGSKLKQQLELKRNEVISHIGDSNDLMEVDEVDKLFAAVQDQTKSKAEIQHEMKLLGLDGDNDDMVKALFAENQYQRILEKSKGTPLYQRLENRSNEVITALVSLDQKNNTEIDQLVEEVHKGDKTKLEIETAMQKLGLDHADEQVKQIFAENQYQRILGNSSGAYFIQQLSDRAPKVISALVGKDKKDSAEIDDLVKAVQNGDKTRSEITSAMLELGLDGADEQVKQIFAENQYTRILKELEASKRNPLLLAQLKAQSDNVIRALMTENKQNAKEVDLLVDSLKNPIAEKSGLGDAMDKLGLERGDEDGKVNELFAEAQYLSILDKVHGNDKLEKQIIDNKDDIIDHLKDISTVAKVSELVDKVKSSTATKMEVQEAIKELGLGEGPANINQIFAENQYKRILGKLENTNKELHTQLSGRSEEVINRLMQANLNEFTDVDRLVEDVTSLEKNKDSIKAAMNVLGLDGNDPDKLNRLFAENQYRRLLDKSKNEGNLKLYDQLKDKSQDVINKLAVDNVTTVKQVTDLIDDIKDTGKNKGAIQSAMTNLGLDSAKADELFGENQYNRLVTEIKKCENTNPKLYAYYTDPVKRVELIKELGGKTDPVALPALDKIGEILLNDPDKRFAQQKTFSKSLEKHAEKLNAIDTLDEVIHLYNPAFQASARKDPEGMKKKYEEVSRECAVMINQLNMQLKELDAMKEGLQQAKTKDFQTNLDRGHYFGTSPALDISSGISHKRLEDQLDFYKRVQNKIDKHVLPAIEHAVQGTKKYYYDPDSVVSFNLPREEVKNLPAIRGKDLGSNTYIVAGSSSTMNFLLDDKPKGNEVRCFDVVFNHHQEATQTEPADDLKIEARFTYDANPPDRADSSMLKGDEIVKSKSSKFEVLQFPRQPEPPTKQLPERVLAEAQVAFAMTMANEILATLDEKPPTKDKPLVIRGFSGKQDEVAFLWTALTILGEKNTKMKFSADAILVRGNSGFQPNKAGASYKKSILESFTAIINEPSEDFENMAKKRFDNTSINNVEKGVGELAAKYKDMKAKIKDAEETVEHDRKLGHP